MSFLEKDSVELRPAEMEDAEFLRNLINKPEVRNTIGRAPQVVNLESERESLEKTLTDDERIMFIIEFEGKPAGDISLGIESQTYRRAEFGIAIHPEFQGNGIGSKAVELMLDYAFNELNLQKVRGGYIEGNEASRKIREKAGFSKVGRFQNYKRKNGEWHDVIWNEVLEEEYRE